MRTFASYRAIFRNLVPTKPAVFYVVPLKIPYTDFLVFKTKISFKGMSCGIIFHCLEILVVELSEYFIFGQFIGSFPNKSQMTKIIAR